MVLLQDGILAALAAVGLTTLVWLLAGLALRPPKKRLHPTLAFLPARGTGEGLEHTLRELEALRGRCGLFGRIVIVDCGLDAQGRELAILLADSQRGVELCTPGQTAGYWN